MTSRVIALLMRAYRDQSGQTLPFMVFLIVLFLGIGGLTLDLGQAYVSYRELQASTDAAALAGGYTLALSTATTSSVKAQAAAFSSVSPGANVSPRLASATVTTTLKCLTTVTNMGILCSASPTGSNALQVVQTAVVPTHFMRVLGYFGVNSARSLTLSATAVAAMRGATNAQYNVAIVVDSTPSMGSNDNDASCNNTRIHCALSGVQTLLASLTPCSAGSTATNCKSPFDSVSLFTFPNATQSTVKYDNSCTAGNPSIVAYSTPSATGTTYTPTSTQPSYQVTTTAAGVVPPGYLSNYSSTNLAGGTLPIASQLGIATGANNGANCDGLQATFNTQNTYYAGAIYAAQASLVAAKVANPNSQNAMIILGDGDAPGTAKGFPNFQSTFTNAAGGSETLNANGNYPSMVNQCGQGIIAAKAATAAGTTVYSVAYGSASSGCSTDTSGTYKNVTPCQAMQDMASTAADFYSDATAAQNKGQCTSTNNPNLTLDQIFKQVATQFTVARLLPVNAS
jgi:hypothetical protein